MFLICAVRGLSLCVAVPRMAVCGGIALLSNIVDGDYIVSVSRLDMEWAIPAHTLGQGFRGAFESLEAVRRIKD